MESKMCSSGEHLWEQHIDYAECKLCHCSMRVINGINTYYDPNGNLFTNTLKDGDKAVAYAEKTLRDIRKGK